MEAISRIPKILDTIEHMRKNQDLSQVFENYKKNVRVFIEAFKAQVSELINHYENTIKNLKLEISTLKSGQQGCKFTRTPPISKFYSTPQKAKLDDLMQTTNSINLNLTKSAKWDSLPVSTIFKKKGFEDSNFQEDFINHYEQAWQNNQSKFEEVSKKRKQREQELRLYLESGKKNMNTTTQMFLEVVGKNKGQQNTNQQRQEEEKEDEESGSRNRIQETLNKSLGQVCESLDRSFIAQRARSEKKKKMASIERQMKSKQKLKEQAEKMLKDRGIKSLLQRLRNNVQISPHQIPDKITTSNLFSTNPKTKKKDDLSNTSRKSKVIIDPVPVDIVNRSRATSYSKDSSLLSPGMKPQSILKRNTTILSEWA